MSQYACYDRNLFNIHFRNSWFTFGNLCTWNQHFCIKCPCMYIIALGPYSLLFVFYTATVTNWGMCVSGANITQQWTNTIREGIIWFNQFLLGGCPLLHTTGYYRWLHTHFTYYDFLLEYTKNTRSSIMTDTDHNRWLYIYYRSLPATLYMVYTIMYVSTDYTNNTRSCATIYTGHD